MTAIDPLKLAAAVKKLAGEVVDVRKENERLDEILSTMLETLGPELQGIVDESIADVKAENERLRQDIKELREDIRFLQGLAAGHELAIMEATGRPTEVIYPAEPEPETPLPSEEELKGFLRRRDYEQAWPNPED
ncbi:hypothetical protein [Microvirga sp. VF16]|uniref:hypothetical protein n=1 Tax=Microvirga sp. VF16 TaxID=2807101 RepID=UPI00193CC6F5|nr:hypothetical protein [Microvirga sp. VF16]QRM31077.1 hypothetical protein JO965_08835 [Microvirga sp. VF16]QRM31094.1 hypothetical protein JO965_08920 [Microvirga sp. VF16]